VILIALFAFVFLVQGNVGVHSLKVWRKYSRRALKAHYSLRYGKGYRNALAEAFPWYENVVQARFWILAQGEKSVRLECPLEYTLEYPTVWNVREKVAEILYPVRVDPRSPLTLKVSFGRKAHFQIIKKTP